MQLNVTGMKNKIERNMILNTLKQQLIELFPETTAGNIKRLNKKRIDLGIDLKEFYQMMVKFKRYRWIVKLNSKKPPTLEDYGTYGLELLTKKNIIKEPSEEQEIIRFKLDFAIRIDSLSCKIATIITN